MVDATPSGSGRRTTTLDAIETKTTGSPRAGTQGRLGIDYDVRTQCVIIALVTLLATISVLSGLKRGIAMLSYVSFVLGMVLVTSVLFMGDTM